MYRYYAPFLFFCNESIRSNLRFLRMLMHMQYFQKQGIKKLHENFSFSSCEINCFDSLKVKIMKEKIVIWASWDYIDYWHNANFRCIEDLFYDVHVHVLCVLMYTYAYIYIYIDSTYVCMCMYLYSYAIYIHICICIQNISSLGYVAVQLCILFITVHTLMFK